jgi:uncharacterized protein (DUF1684 family)
MSDLEIFRQQKNDFFEHHPQSPLTREQMMDFKGLKYFPENEALRLEVEVELISPRDRIEMQTTTGDTQVYERYGHFKFEVDGQTAELTIFHGQHGYFLPFVDSLASTETYPAGRYLEPEPVSGGRFLVDFNEAYNPYCAYNEMYSCPITPFENRIKVPVRAGEKLFK